MRCDLLILLTPLTFGGYSSELKKALDRAIARELPFFGRVNGEVHHVPRYTRQAGLLAIGVAADEDEEERTYRTAPLGNPQLTISTRPQRRGAASRPAS